MKKKLIIIGICFALSLMLLPLKYQYKDGGTVEYRAILYNIIKWHSLDNNYDSGYKTDTEFHFFPANLRRIDFYRNTIPQRLELKYNDNIYFASTLDYEWCNEYNNCESRDVLLNSDVDYSDAIKVKENDNINIIQNYKIKDIVIYKGTLDNMYSQDIEYTDEYIKTPKEKGDYVYIVSCFSGDNKVNYLFKVVVE